MNTLHYPERYELWLRHDLEKFRPDFYNALKPEDQPRVWQFIEKNYLLNYKCFLRIEFEWAADGIWRIPFPGSVSLEGCYDPDLLKLPAEIASDLRRWHDHIEENYEPWSHGKPFDMEASNQMGLAIAKRIKACIETDIYLEFNPFQELLKQGNDVIELPVPDFLSRCQSQGASTGA